MSETPCDKSTITTNLAFIQQQILTFCQKYQKNTNFVQLLAVSKNKPIEDIRSAYLAGQTRFGENYLQEALKKIKALNDTSIEWHFIGAIQSNKTRELAEHFPWIHSVDRLKIAQRLSQQRPTSLPSLNICLQINISEEASKSGFSLVDIESVARKINSLPNIRLRGLMAIPAKATSSHEQREAFARMNQVFCTLQKQYPQIDTLSMGMSNDMEAAIAEGSTLLRIGRAIFGDRNPAGL